MTNLIHDIAFKLLSYIIESYVMNWILNFYPSPVQELSIPVIEISLVHVLTCKLTGFDSAFNTFNPLHCGLIVFQLTTVRLKKFLLITTQILNRVCFQIIADNEL